jgi:hypothetical protein
MKRIQISVFVFFAVLLGVTGADVQFHQAFAQTAVLPDTALIRDGRADAGIFITVNPLFADAALPIRLTKSDAGLAGSAAIVFQHGKNVGIEKHGLGAVSEEITSTESSAFNAKAPYCKIASEVSGLVKDFSLSSQQAFAVKLINILPGDQAVKLREAGMGAIPQVEILSFGQVQDLSMFPPKSVKQWEAQIKAGNPVTQKLTVHCFNFAEPPTFGALREALGTLFIVGDKPHVGSDSSKASNIAPTVGQVKSGTSKQSTRPAF